MERLLRPLLLQALTPVAQAMRRQEELLQVQLGQQSAFLTQRLVSLQTEQMELLLEILQSLQPSAETQLSPLIGLPLPRT